MGPLRKSLKLWRFLPKWLGKCADRHALQMSLQASEALREQPPHSGLTRREKVLFFRYNAGPLTHQVLLPSTDCTRLVELLQKALIEQRKGFPPN
jgi:hypothetical protein